MIVIQNLAIGLYSLVGQRGFYFKNKNGYDGLGGATLQITKNFKTLRTVFQKFYFFRQSISNFCKMEKVK